MMNRTEEMQILERGQLLFLLGAGASASAGMPLLKGLKEEVKSELAPHLRRVFEHVASSMVRFGERPEERTIEDVLYLLDTALLGRTPHGDLSLRDLAILEYEVRSAIWKRLAARVKIDSLRSFGDFVSRTAGLDVFSLNNDLVIEQLAEELGIRCCTGFTADGLWSLDSFREAETALRLHKLHGSVDWQYRAGWPMRRHTGGIIHKPDGTAVFRSPVGELALVFPSQNKVVTAIPLLELLMRFCSTLQDAELLVVVGYRMADSHVHQAVKHALGVNRTLKVLVVNPSSEAVDRLIPRKASADISARVDFLPMRFNDALRTGHLNEAIERALSGRKSIQATLRQATRALAGAGNMGEIERACDDLRTISERDELPLGAFIKELRPPKGMPGADDPASALDPIWGWASQAVHELQNGQRSHIADTLETASREVASHCVLSSIGITGIGPHRYLVAASRVVELFPEWRFETKSRRLADPYGVAVLQQTAYVIERRTLGIEGLGTLRAVDMRNGRIRRVLPPRCFDTRAVRPRSLWNAYRRRATIAVFKEALLEAGFLNYPTSVRVVNDEQLLVVEANRAFILDIHSGERVKSLDSSFRNLADGWVADHGRRIFLLEGGMHGEGRIWLWNLADDQMMPLAIEARNFAGIAFHEQESAILMTIGEEHPNGRVLKCRIGPHGETGLAEIVAEGLHVPRYIWPAEGKDWYCTTAWGPVRFRA